MNHRLGIRFFFLIGCVEECRLKESVRERRQLRGNEVNSPQRANLALILSPLPSQNLTEPQHVMELENKLELANLELRLAQKQLDFEREGYRNRIIELDEQVTWLWEQVGRLLSDRGKGSRVEFNPELSEHRLH